MLTLRSSSDRCSLLHILTFSLLTTAAGTSAEAQVLVRVTSFSAAHQGPNVIGSFAETNNGVIDTRIGNGGTATATPSGPGITQGRAETFQPGGAGSASFSSGTTTTANLLTAKHTGAVVVTPYDNFGTPGGTSNSRLEDVLTFVNTNGGAADVSVSWIVDGFVTPPGAPFVGSHDIRGAMRLWALGSASPSLKGSPRSSNEVTFTFVNGVQGYKDDLSGAVFTAGAGPIWTITPLSAGGVRIAGVLSVPTGLSTLKVMNSLDIDCRAGMSCDYSLTGAQMSLGALPAGVAMASESGVFLGAGKPSPSPTGLTLQSIVGNQVTLRWAPPTSTAATGYVLQGGAAPGQTLGSLPIGASTTFTFGAPTGAFYLRVLAQTANGPSAPSNEVLAYVNVPAPPSAPANLLGLANGGQVALSWRNTSTGGTPTGIVLDVNGPLSGSVPLPLGETFTYPLIPSGTYTFAVRATNPTGASTASAPVTLTFPSACPGAPQPPANFTVTKSGGTLALAWDPPASGPAVSSYVLNVSGAVTLALPLSTRSLSGGVPPGTYTFTVSAANPCGTGVPTAAQTITVP